jgi:hypothetical protein
MEGRPVAVSGRRIGMSYKIVCNGKVIAAFVNESDRNVCIEVLREMYDDCTFEVRDD